MVSRFCVARPQYSVHVIHSESGIACMLHANDISGIRSLLFSNESHEGCDIFRMLFVTY